MDKVLSPTELCSSILLIKLPGSRENSDTNGALRGKPAVLKVFSETKSGLQIRSIISQLASARPFEEVLAKAEYSSPFVIPNFPKDYAKMQPEVRDIAVVLNSFLTLCVHKMYDDTEKVCMLLRACNTLLYNPNLNASYRQMVTSAFITTFKRSYIFFDGEEMRSLVRIVCEFFVKPMNVPHSVFEMLPILTKRVVNVNTKELLPVAAELISYIDSLVIQMGDAFPSDHLVSILQSCTGALGGLDTTAMILFSHVSGVLDDQKLLAFLPIITRALVARVEEDPVANAITESETEAVFLTDASSYINEDVFVTHPTFEGEVDLTNMVEFPEELPVDTLLSKELLRRIAIASKVITSNEALAKNFVLTCPKIFQPAIGSDHGIDIILATFVIFKQIIKNYKVFLPLDILSHKLIFDPAVTVFSPGENWQKVNTMRSLAIELMLNEGSVAIQTVLYSTMVYPLLFAEMMHRFLNANQLTMDQNDVMVLGQTLMSTMIYYQKFKNLSDESRKASAKARLSIFYYLNHILSGANLLKMFFDDQFFTDAYLSLMFEAPVRHIILATLTSFLMLEGSDENKYAMTQIINSARTASKQLHRTEAVVMMTDFINVLEKAVLHVPKYAAIFSPIIAEICTGATHVPKIEESRTLVLSLLDFMTSTAVQHNISAPEVFALEKVITGLFEEPSPVLFGKIVQLIAGQVLPSMHPSFTIRQPKVLRLMIAVFLNSPMLIETIGFVAKLCQSSLKNSEEAHRGEFDLYLIELLNGWRNDNTVSIKLVASVVSLLMMIANTVSSVAVVQSFMSVLCPVEGKFFPCFHKLMMKSLTSMILSAPQRPVAVLPFTKASGFNFHGLKPEAFQNGVTFTFWLNLNETNPFYKPQLVVLQDPKDDFRLGVFINSASVLVCLEADTRQWSARLECTINTKTWTFLAITFRVDKYQERYNVHAFCNGEESRDIYFPYVSMQNSILSGRVGGVSPDSVDVEQPSLFGPVGIFGCLPPDDIRRVYEMGPAVSSAHGLSPACFFVPHERSGNVSVVNTGVDKNVTLSEASFRHIHAVPFSDILVTRCGIELILPLFAQWDMTFQDKTEFEYFSSTTLDLLEKMLMMSEEAQMTFSMSSGFKILSHLLMSSKEKHITYNLYLKFVTLFGNLTCEDLRAQLFDSILFNIELWLRANAENHRRIVRHWSRVLVPTCREMLIKLRPFGMLLSALRGYYWYEIAEPQIVLVKERCRGETLNVKECRQSILMIAHVVARHSFTEADFRNLMSYILTCKDYDQNVDLLRFLNELMAEQKAMYINIQSSASLILLLQYLFNIKNNDIVCLTLKTIIDAHNAGVLQELTIEQHMDIMLHQIVPEFVTKTLLSDLIELTTTYHEVYPICSWMAMNIGEKGIRQMLSKLKPDTRYACGDYWALYSIVALYNADDKLRGYFSRFLLQCSTKCISILFATIEVVGRALGQPSDPLKHVMLREYGKMLLRGVPNLSVDVYMAIARHFLFFRCDDGQDNEAMKSLYDRSAYVERTYVRSYPGRAGRRTGNMSPKAARRRTARQQRHSLRPNSILCPEESGEDRYSPLLAQRALAFLNPARPQVHARREFHTRRTSLMTVGRQRMDFEAPMSPDNVLVSLTPAQFDEKIAEIASREVVYKFGIRLDKNQNWEDAEIAEQVLNIFRDNATTDHLETILVICSFLVHFNPDAVNSLVKSINFSGIDVHGALALLDHHLEMSRLPKLSSISTDEINQSAFTFLAKFQSISNNTLCVAPLRFMKYIMKFQAANSEKAFDIFKMITEDIVGTSANVLADYSDMVSQAKTKQKKLWRQYWRCMTIDRAPWRQSIPIAAAKEVHYKRDMILCGNMCPVKVKQNDKFTDHMDASFLRDTGSAKGAQAKLDEYRTALARQYEEDAPTDLLEAVVERESEVNNRRKSMMLQPCIIELPCEWINVKGSRNATFSLFVDSVVLSKESGKITRIKSYDITNVLLRTHLHHPTAIEIFTASGRTYFINFFDVNALTVLSSFKKVSLPRLHMLQTRDFKSNFTATKATSKWVDRSMSNFEYLMNLNLLSGRSFNNTSQYPIFPWVISDYTSESIDLKNPNVYRDLSLPIGATTPERINDLKNKIKAFEDLGMDQYLYSCGPVNPLNVYLWNLRMEPFTSLHIDIQSGRFDHAARLFSSIGHAYHLVTTMQNDYRELIPEFFCAPEFLTNRDRFDFGQFDGKKVDDVELPPWAENPLDFIYTQRKALESDYVTRNLNKWIDLIWGDKQRGEKAEAASNTYLPQIYDCIWDEKTLNDPVLRAQIEAIQCHVGQMPAQLFEQPHPSRLPSHQRGPAISSIISVGTGASTIISSHISVTDGKARISTIDASGHCMITSFDQNYLSKMNKSKPVRNPSGNVSSLSQLVRGANNRHSGGDSLVLPTVRVDASSDVIVSNKPIRGFNQIRSSPSSKVISTFTHDGSFLVVGSNKTDMFKVRVASATADLVQRQRDEIVNISCNSEWTATANRDAELLVFRGNDFNRPIFTIPSFTSSISCSDVSDYFHSIVFGTRDGSLLFCCLSSGSIVKVIDTEECRPSAVMITPGWGFVAVYLTKIVDGALSHFISLYTINGDLIKTKQISHGIVAWSTFKTPEGFDFINFADDHGDCYVFEAYYMNPEKPFYNTTKRVSSIAMMQQTSTNIIVTEEGRIVFVPVTLK